VHGRARNLPEQRGPPIPDRVVLGIKFSLYHFVLTLGGMKRPNLDLVIGPNHFWR
jgi:hypothetical protein